MSNLQIFNNAEFGSVRVVEINGEGWLVGKDVAEALGYENQNRDIVRHVSEDDRMMLDGKTQYQNGIELGQRGGWLINESGVYALIFGSKLPKAKEFKHWVTSEVLPTIRKYGTYTLSSYQIEDPIERAKKWIEEQEAHKKQLAILEPKAEFADFMQKTEDSVLVRQFAKVLSSNGIAIGEKRLYKWFRDHNYIFKNSTMPYQEFVDKGWFVIDTKPSNNGKFITQTTRVTVEGMRHFLDLFLKGRAKYNG